MRVTSGVRMLLTVAGGVLAGWFAGQEYRPSAGVTQAAAPVRENQPTVALAAPGRVEGKTDPVNISAGIDGVLSSVLVDEGDQVRAGTLVARVDRPDLASELQQARAMADSARHAKTRLLRGSRDEQRQEAAAEAARAKAMLSQAQSHFERQEKLFRSEDIPRAAYDRARTELTVAEAAVRAAIERERLVNAEPLEEELARADSEIAAAEERTQTIQARIDKCSVRSPISGMVVRRFLRPGEVVSTVFPQPIVSVVDASKLRVRAEVDERDLRHVEPGQSVLISADALGTERVSGRVLSLGPLMGKKRVRTGDPAEKSDRDVLEVVIDIEKTDARLILGLRVTVQFLAPGQTS